MVPEKKLILAINRIPSITSREKAFLADIIDNENTYMSMNSRNLRNLIERNARLNRWCPEEGYRLGMEDADNLTGSDVSFASLMDRDYPPQLREIYDPPFILFYKGKMPDYNKPLVSIVGTRMATGRALQASFKTAFELAGCNIDVVSGLAKGIDSAAHWGCVSGNGASIAVLGCGIDQIYPPENKKLAAAVLTSGGGILSEYPPGTPPARYNFPARNRIISGLSRTIVVIQAPKKSGALITADYALEHGRDLMVHADGLTGRAGEGTGKMASEGAAVITGAEGIIADWGYSSVVTKTTSLSGRGVKPGQYLAEILEKELSGGVFRYNGICYRRAFCD